MKPKRIQRKRTKGWKMPPNTVCVSRPSKWGNPFKVGVLAANATANGATWYLIRNNRAAVAWYRRLWINRLKHGTSEAQELNELRGKNLACWCPLDQPCHADVLLELANIRLFPEVQR